MEKEIDEFTEKLKGIKFFLDEIETQVNFIEKHNPTKQEMINRAGVVKNLIFTIKGIIQ